MPNTWLWLGFSALVVVMLVLDLAVVNRKAHAISFRGALAWVVVWVSVALLFNAVVWHWKGGGKALEFLTGYLIEYSLSMDNVFVFLLIFNYFRVPAQFQHRVLFWGVMGALVLRAVMIVAGIALISLFHWILYVFGGFLVLTGVKMALEKDKEIHPERNPVLRLFRRLMPVSKDYDDRGRFFIRQAGRLLATPLFVVILVVETTDVIFAVDSIPAIFGITTDPFIVYTSNVFAIMGLRSLFFVLAGMMRQFHHLHYGLSLVLVFVGAKMLASYEGSDGKPFLHVPIGISLGVVAGLLVVSVIASLIWPAKERPETASTADTVARRPD